MKFKQLIKVFLIIAILLSSFAFSQKGKHGSLTVISTNTRVNEFTTLTSNASAGNSTISAIENTENCLAVTSRTIEVINEPFGIIPQLISPNGDGKNETFEIKGIQQFTDSELQIFNRWGNKVYSMKNYDNSFDGTANHKSVNGKLPTGTYFYILTLGGSENKTYNGYFQLAY